MTTVQEGTKNKVNTTNKKQASKQEKKIKTGILSHKRLFPVTIPHE
jgi:hypothetical protein